MPTSRFRPIFGLLMGAPVLLALSACNNKAKPDADRNAEGKVLQGSISDDMIAFDQLRSQGQQQEPEASGTDAARSDNAKPDADADERAEPEAAETSGGADQGTATDEG